VFDFGFLYPGAIGIVAGFATGGLLAESGKYTETVWAVRSTSHVAVVTACVALLAVSVGPTRPQPSVAVPWGSTTTDLLVAWLALVVRAGVYLSRSVDVPLYATGGWGTWLGRGVSLATLVALFGGVRVVDGGPSPTASQLALLPGGFGVMILLLLATVMLVLIGGKIDQSVPFGWILAIPFILLSVTIFGYGIFVSFLNLLTYPSVLTSVPWLPSQFAEDQFVFAVAINVVLSLPPTIWALLQDDDIGLGIGFLSPLVFSPVVLFLAVPGRLPLVESVLVALAAVVGGVAAALLVPRRDTRGDDAGSEESSADAVDAITERAPWRADE
jgi:hypothetical protein